MLSVFGQRLILRSKDCVLRLSPHYYWPQLEAGGWPVKFDAIGGMQTQICRTANAQQRLGTKQIVLTLAIPGAPRRWEAETNLMVFGVRVPLLSFRSRIRGMIDLNISWLLGVLLWLARYGLPSVAHVHMSGVWEPLLAAFLLSLFRPVIITIHCSALETYHPMSALDRLRLKFARALERAAIRRAAQVVVLTPRLHHALTTAIPQSADKVTVISDSIDAASFRAMAYSGSSQLFRDRFKLPSGVPIIGYIGRIAHEKGWRFLLDLCDRMRDQRVHFLICGDGNERQELEYQARIRGLSKLITVTGFLPQHTIALALRTINVLVLTSLHEEFGSVLLEAMAMTVPIVAFSVGGVPYVLDDGKAGVLVPSGDVNMMAQRVMNVLDDPKVSRELVEHARKRVEDIFDCDAAAVRLRSLYVAIAGKRIAEV